jgi:two-component system response regulator VicR
MKKKIVLIQDNAAILDIIDDVLTDEGFEVTASLTTEPIKNIESIQPDLLIVDDHLKDSKKGSEIIAELKSDPNTEDVSAILTSTSNDLAEVSKSCNADDYIEKPFDIDHMVEVVKNNS